ncbi:MAG: enterotoxin [Phycisphaerales bacterium]
MSARRWKQALVCWIVFIGLSGVETMRAEGSIEYPGPEPGTAKASAQDGDILLSNNILECKWMIVEGRLRPMHILNRSFPAVSFRSSECFELLLADGRVLKASDLKIVRGPQIDGLGAKSAGKQVRVLLATPDDSLAIQWRAELRDGSNYVRQYVAIAPKTANADLRETVLVQLDGQHATPAGTLDGSPVTVGDTYFFAFEHPLSKVRTRDSKLECSLPRSMPLKPGEEQTCSSVMGVAPQGQLRRAFLYYVERERAQPYRPFLHYNSWYDLGYGLGKILEPDALKVIDLFGKELIEQRHVVMDSFVPDDGWDDPASLWRFHEGFPNGFATLQQRAQRYKSGVGAWLSPWGGYGKAKEERMKYGRQEGFETNKTGFSMAGPRYYARFLDACLGMVRDYDLNYFKFDGISDGGTPTGAAAGFESDVEALLRLIDDLRRAKPSLFINVTTGTWSSPYWLWYADSTWRSGADWSTCGWGSKRQQQITYRDAQTWQNVVSRAPLYPINSLMTQGVMFANHGLPDEATGLVEDIHAFFASGTNCQELYITPSLLDAHTWDVLAEAANWARGNADVLVDTHWIGGAPAKGEVYGWASWSKRKGILALRNPADGPGRIVIDIGEAFELPEGAARRYSFKSPWKSDASAGEIRLSAGEDHTFELRPFEVLVFDATPL